MDDKKRVQNSNADTEMAQKIDLDEWEAFKEEVRGGSRPADSGSNSNSNSRPMTVMSGSFDTIFSALKEKLGLSEKEEDEDAEEEETPEDRPVQLQRPFIARKRKPAELAQKFKIRYMLVV